MAKRIMIQGTMSGVGKSLIAAALCRLFHEDGYKVAPFKSQNMALNSYVTADGKEMGRAQVLQAAAAGIEPDVRMNPVLLKPGSDTGSQVILLGEIYGDYAAKDYFNIKRSLVPKIMSAYESLAAENDIIVIEGAGSPAEINLKKDDIVNMGFAEMVDAPVLLVGDIDPGGVFAQLYGTLGLLEEKERDRVEGLIINRFRGDVSLLENGLDMIEELTGKPVLGVVPYLKLDVDDEDSLSDRFRAKGGGGLIDIAIIRLPHISNFTDFSPLERHADISVRYVEKAGDMGSPDMMIIPGTKNTTGDLRWLRDGGFEDEIKRLRDQDTLILGVCGGYQILGQYIEEESESEKGLGLLPVKTVFSDKKLTVRSKARCASLFDGVNIEGYQIHMGVTEVSGGEAFCVTDEGIPDGCVKGRVMGTYLHGLFDTGELTETLVSLILSEKGIKRESRSILTHDEHLNEQLDLLAKTVRQRLDMKRIYMVMEAYEHR